MSVEYQHGVFARTPIKATQIGDTLRVEIGPVRRRLSRHAEGPAATSCVFLRTGRLHSVTVNGIAVRQAGPRAKEDGRSRATRSRQ